MVLMPAVVFTLFPAVETEPLPFGSIFFVALLVTFVVLRRAACESRPASRLKLRHGQHLRYPGQRPATQHDVTGGLPPGTSRPSRVLQLVAFRATAPVARFLPSTLVPSSVSGRAHSLSGRQVRIEALLASLEESDPILLRSPNPL